MPSVTAVTPWHNHPELARDYWEAIEAGLPDDVIIVDNGSDPPLEYPGVRLDQNTGFCHANNAGAEHATTDAILFLNNDIRMHAANWLRQIRDQLAPGRIVGQISNGAHTHIDGQPNPYIDGWCLAIMCDDFRQLGGWDETLVEPAYYSDNLLSLRALEHNMELVHVPDLGLLHLNNGTSRDDPQAMNTAATVNRAAWEQAVRAQPVTV